MLKQSVLIVEDDELLREFLFETLNSHPFEIDSAGDAKTAKEMIKNKMYHLVLTDLKLPDKNGMTILNFVKKVSPDTGVIVMTAYGTVENAVEAMKIGAFDYITKPFTADQIDMIILKYFDFSKLENENKMLRTQLGKMYEMENVVGHSANMMRIFEIIQTVAESNATILIHGPSGTGKEVIAKAIHFNSKRRKKAFIKVNCAALPEGLVESELFGHEKGAFTGAIKNTRGRFELADGGTLMLDEITEMSLHLQAKLLRVLQEKSFEKVGNPETVEVDIRVIATTNRDLKEAVKNGEFREDLFYRLNVVPIQLPPLKNRKDDIPLLVKHFIEKSAKENEKNIPGISAEAMNMLINHDWPGNVRELENTIERAVVICRKGMIKPQHFLTFYDSGMEMSASDNGNGDVKNLAEIEKRTILDVLLEKKGNRTHAAGELGISVRTLRNKIKEYKEKGIVIPE